MAEERLRGIRQAVARIERTSAILPIARRDQRPLGIARSGRYCSSNEASFQSFRKVPKR